MRDPVAGCRLQEREMSQAPKPTGIRAWTPAARIEPFVRIGIILDEDAFDVVRLRVPDEPYLLESPATEPRRLGPGTVLEVRRSGAGVAATVGNASPIAGDVLRLVPTARPAGGLTPAGAGVTVHGVVAGRGFHWQKRIDETLGGVLELVPGRRGVVLVNELPLEDYLAGVITAEMSGACPADLLKAQCVVARSWLLAMTEPKHETEPFDRCNDDCCQRYQGTGDLGPTALAAVRNTRGEVLLAPTGAVLDANYAKSCGGISETPWAVWGLDKPGISPIVDAPADAAERGWLESFRARCAAGLAGEGKAPAWPSSGADQRRDAGATMQNDLDEYLDGAWLKTTRCYCSPNMVPVEAIGRYLGRVDTTDDYFRWTVRYERAELEALLRDKLTDARELVELRDLRVRARGVSGRAYIVEVEWANARGDVVCSRVESEYRIRQVLHRKFLYSSAFAVRPQRDADGRLVAVTLRGAGWGHGVGMCQIGALGMALAGIDHAAICRHYYPNARLETVYT